MIRILARYQAGQMTCQIKISSMEFWMVHRTLNPAFWLVCQQIHGWTVKLITHVTSLISCNDSSCSKLSRIWKFIFSENNITKGSSSYYLCVEYFPQFSFDSEMYTKSAAVSKKLLILYTFLNQMRIGKNIQYKDDRMNSL